jgi:hypothetical protein
MTEPVGRERAIRFLLGELPDEERDALEDRFFVEDDAFEELKEAEDDLRDAYSRGTLSTERRARFEARYLQDEAGHRRVAFARALRAASARREGAAPARRVPATWAWAAALAGLALAGALFGLARTRGALERAETERSELARATAEQQGRAQGLAEEVERLRARVADLEQRLGRDLDRVLSLTLVPGLAREAGSLSSLTIGPDASRVELTLMLKEDPYPGYRVAIETADGRKIWAGSASATDASAGARALRVSVPAQDVPPGHYVVTVEGTQPGRPAVPHADYVFRVLPPRPKSRSGTDTRAPSSP